MTIFNNIVLATADTLPVIAATPAYTLANDLMFASKDSIFTALSAQSGSNGICTPNITGFNKPLLNVVFLRPFKTLQAALVRLTSCYGGLCREGESLAVPVSVVQNPTQSTAMRFAPSGGGLIPNTGHTAMNTSSATAPKIQQTQLEEFKDAAIALCGGNAFLFLPIPSPTALSQIIVKCERLLIAAKSLQTEGGVA